MRGLISALRTLTILPIPGEESHKLSEALRWFPLVGATIGFFLYLLSTGFIRLTDSRAVGAALFVGFSALITGGIHLDGLADFSDALQTTATQKRRLEIMKDSRIGAFAAVAVALNLLIKWALIFALFNHGAGRLTVVAFTNSRLSMTYSATFLNYARNEGGTGEGFVKDASVTDFLMALAVTLALDGIPFAAGGVCLLLISMAFTIGFAAFCKEFFGGVTGDILGATNEIVELITLLSALMLITILPWSFKW